MVRPNQAEDLENTKSSEFTKSRTKTGKPKCARLLEKSDKSKLRKSTANSEKRDAMREVPTVKGVKPM